MKVLIISAHSEPIICGIGDYTKVLSENLKASGIDVVTVGLKSNPLFRFLKSFKMIYLIHKILKKYKFDMIHLQYEAFSFNQSYLLPIYLMQQSQPFIVTFHEVFQKSLMQIWRDKKLLKSCSAAIVNDRGRYLSLLKLSPESKNKIYSLSVGSNLPNRHALIASQNFLVGYFGFINAVKRLETLFESFRLIHKQFPLAKLRLIGDFNPNGTEIINWKKWTLDHKLEHSVEWIGACHPLKASELIQQCQLMILPFSDGASPRRGSLQACLALGKALITSQPLLDEPEMNGLCFIPSDDVSLWSSKAIQILESPTLRESYEKTSLEISENFSWDKISKSHIDIYSKIMRIKE